MLTFLLDTHLEANIVSLFFIFVKFSKDLKVVALFYDNACGMKEV